MIPAFAEFPRDEVLHEIAGIVAQLPPIQRAWFIEQWEFTCERRGWPFSSAAPLLPAPNCVCLPPEARG